MKSIVRPKVRDAESTIRDTDVAEEMMSYTKNNILVQSAQAMLAQAYQVAFVFPWKARLLTGEPPPGEHIPRNAARIN